jgi:periplasmic copper chaperone A
MKLKNTALLSSAVAVGTLLAVSTPLPASAHVSVNASSAAAGSYTVLTFSVSHGCEGSPTTALSIDIPEAITAVTPTVHPNWDVSKVSADAAAPIDDGHGESSANRTGQIVYTAKAPLLEGFRDTFELSMQLPADAAGETLAFPVLQTCEVGETQWNELASEGSAEPEHPAPTVAVTAASGSAHGHGDAGADLTATPASETSDTGDIVARSLGLGGLVVGAIGIVLAVTARRKTAAE